MLYVWFLSHKVLYSTSKCGKVDGKSWQTSIMLFVSSGLFFLLWKLHQILGVSRTELELKTLIGKLFRGAALLYKSQMSVCLSTICFQLAWYCHNSSFWLPFATGPWELKPSACYLQLVLLPSPASTQSQLNLRLRWSLFPFDPATHPHPPPPTRRKSFIWNWKGVK